VFTACGDTIAHEINQPLSGIITNAGTCLRMLDAIINHQDGNGPQFPPALLLHAEGVYGELLN